jgi:hypothetical protein
MESNTPSTYVEVDFGYNFIRVHGHVGVNRIEQKFDSYLNHLDKICTYLQGLDSSGTILVHIEESTGFGHVALADMLKRQMPRALMI